jgi:hypothetical protein
MPLVTPATFADVFELLARYRVSYVVIGGVAVALHGYDRPVADLDLVVGPSPAEQQLVLQVLLEAGFVSSLPLSPAMVRVMRLFDQREREIDVFFRHHIQFDHLWEHKATIDCAGYSLPVASFADLIRMKEISHTPQDQADLEYLRALRK